MNDQTAPLNDQAPQVTTEPPPVQNDLTETAQLAEPANNVAPIVPTKSRHKKSKTVASKYLAAKPKNVKTRDVNSLSEVVEPVNNYVSAQAAKVHRKVCLLMSLFYALAANHNVNAQVANFIYV